MKKVISKAMTVALCALTLSIPTLAAKDGASYGNVPKWTEAITIDGTKDAAYDHALNLNISRKHYPDQPDTAATGESYILWADGFIYAYGEVADATLIPTTEDVQSNTPWTVDSFEIFLDEGNDGMDPIQFRIDYTGRPSFQLSSDVNSFGKDASVCNGVFEFAAVKSDKGYSVEFKIPFAVAKLGENVGLQIQINDVNESGQTCLFSTSSLNAGSWDSTLYDYMVLADAPVLATDAPDSATTEAPQTSDAGIVMLAALFVVASIVSIRLVKGRR